MPSQKVTRMIQHGKAHVREALQDVKETAPCYIQRGLGHPRAGSERCALFEVLFDAYLVQSVTRALHHLDTQAVNGHKPTPPPRVLEHTLTRVRANLKTSQQVLRHALVIELGDRRERTLKVPTDSQPPERPLAPVLAFRNPR